MSYTHLTAEERYVISHLHGLFSIREIARRLGRHHATISREIRRARLRYPHTRYWYIWTHRVALDKRSIPRHNRRLENSRLVHYVVSRLRLQWSPEEIAQRIAIDYPDKQDMRVSHETIYRWVYLDGGNGGNLFKHLRRRRKKRRRQKRYGAGRRFTDRKGIDQRPEVVSARERFGDWEGDTIEGKQRTGFIATIVERKSRYLIAGKIEDKMAKTLTRKGVELYGKVPRKMRKTLTVDNGPEFAQFKKFEESAGLEIFFAKPYSPWQRGANENTNGLLRQYFPKGYNFKKVTDLEVKEAVWRLNNRPRKCLGYRTPHEVFWQAARGALAI